MASILDRMTSNQSPLEKILLGMRNPSRLSQRRSKVLSGIAGQPRELGRTQARSTLEAPQSADQAITEDFIAQAVSNLTGSGSAGGSTIGGGAAVGGGFSSPAGIAGSPDENNGSVTSASPGIGGASRSKLLQLLLGLG